MLQSVRKSASAAQVGDNDDEVVLEGDLDLRDAVRKEDSKAVSAIIVEMQRRINLTTENPKERRELLAEFLNEKDENGDTPLHDACLYAGTFIGANSVRCTTILARHGAGLNVQNKEGNTPMHYAVLGFAALNQNMGKDLREVVSKKFKEKDLTELHDKLSAVQFNALMLFMGALIKVGADCTIKNYNGRGCTALQYLAHVMPDSSRKDPAIKINREFLVQFCEHEGDLSFAREEKERAKKSTQSSRSGCIIL